MYSRTGLVVLNLSGNPVDCRNWAANISATGRDASSQTTTVDGNSENTPGFGTTETGFGTIDGNGPGVAKVKKAIADSIEQILPKRICRSP